MADLYKIRDWQKHFENNRTREMKTMGWIPVPVKLAGDGYTEIISDENGAAHFGCWIAILEVAARCEPRGTLIRAGGIPHDPASLSRITRIPTAVWPQALRRLTAVGWLELEVIEIKVLNNECGEGAVRVRDECGEGAVRLPSRELNEMKERKEGIEHSAPPSASAQTQDGGAVVTKRREPNPFWDAMIAIWFKEGVIGPAAQKRVGKLAKEFRELNATEAEIRLRKGRMEKAWPTISKISPECVLKHWGEFSQPASDSPTFSYADQDEAAYGPGCT